MASTPAVTDFSGFSALRARARTDDPQALRAAAQQFEALFTQMLLKSMRDASLGEDLMSGEQGGFYRDLFDQQIALSMASGKGLGIADMLVRQLQPPPAQAAQPQAFALPSPAPAQPQASTPDAEPLPPAPPPQAAEAAQAASIPPPADALTADEAFIARVLPHAGQAGAALGVAPHMLVAQSALESDWGRSELAASNNVFGIKAGDSWRGERASLETQEYRDGQAHTERAAFRAYASVADSFADYARLVGGQARYAPVRNAGADSARFAEGLQQAGYATDPAYAQKLRALAEDPQFLARVQQAAQRLGLGA